MSEGEAQIRATPYSAPMEKFAGSTILQLTNPESELYKLELTLRGQILDKEGNPIQTEDPLLNEKGINSVIGQVQMIVNQVTVMSNLKKDDIFNLHKYLRDTLVFDLMRNRVNYSIKNPSARDRIMHAALTSGLICMKRAEEGDEKTFLKGSQQEITTRTLSEKPKSNFARLGFWK